MLKMIIIFNSLPLIMTITANPPVDLNYGKTLSFDTKKLQHLQLISFNIIIGLAMYEN